MYKKSKINKNKNQALDKALKFAQKADIKIRDFSCSSAKVADKLQKKAEDNIEDN